MVFALVLCLPAFVRRTFTTRLIDCKVMGIFFACCISLPTTRLSVTSGIGTRPSMMTRKPTVGAGAASSGACGHPSAWPVLRRLPWPRRFLAKAIRGPEPGAPVLEPLHLTRVLGPPPDVYLNSLLSFFVFLYLSVCEALKLRSLPFNHAIYVASRSFQ